MTPGELFAELLADGKAAAAKRGHDVTFRQAVGNCTRCGYEVVVMLDPPANGVDIGGEAVALDCPHIWPRS